ncbi:glycosyltransferase [Francisella sp. 19X1-34]|uniref:glycosyltransferase n=1 Tax=Francisella sp. 19X1-34 TaxID=3087177 RepID=UPI002E377BF2|nr:glycosyltransferase [Francisella sp. 19X1-34]MED7787547.1 glycosyltransferase [Francisella sp. 19X1-34]
MIARFRKFFIKVGVFPFIIFSSILYRFLNKEVDIGIGPCPIINNVYHKKALQRLGYKVETFVYTTYFITNDFDINLSNHGMFKKIFTFIQLPFKYNVLIIYFNGGPLSILGYGKLEPFLYKLAKVKTIVLPYGSDIQDMSRSANLYFKHVMSIDYSNYRFKRVDISRQIDLWTQKADFIFSGCEWVDYMYYWDQLMLGHFSIDIEDKKFINKNSLVKIKSDSFKVLHAPNHSNIKGTSFFVEAVRELKEEGYDIELIIKQKVPNEEIIAAIHSVDLVLDQLVVGWYAMFSLEAMSCNKPVVCFLRDDLINLYKRTNLLVDCPVINANIENIKDKIAWCYNNREKLESIAGRGRDFVKKNHSLESVGKIFDGAIKKIM